MPIDITIDTENVDVVIFKSYMDTNLELLCTGHKILGGMKNIRNNEYCKPNIHVLEEKVVTVCLCALSQLDTSHPPVFFKILHDDCFFYKKDIFLQNDERVLEIGVFSNYLDPVRSQLSKMSKSSINSMTYHKCYWHVKFGRSRINLCRNSVFGYSF